MTDKFSSAYNDSDADLILVSSDNVYFRVYSYYLKASSPVFRAMLELPDPSVQEQKVPRIELVDESSETADTLTAALDILHGKNFPDHIASYFFTLSVVVQFFQKYECTGALLDIRLLLQSWISAPGGGPAWLAFYLGAILDDVIVCSRAIRKAWPRSFTMIKDESAGALANKQGVAQGFVLDVDRWDLDMYTKSSPRITWALLRARRNQKTVPQDQAGWDSVAREFCDILGVEGELLR
ncbi:hypothetical protein M231_00690 [Tremella mesenterica]|uniref:BTB domain-containing protein n=1 Tax=Tremella mesenterica TaxID=5217 RepID=A0A4Q1BV04_TREME|nr:hypothetical protein M231_00690 [Tremella mesenterica]